MPSTTGASFSCTDITCPLCHGTYTPPAAPPPPTDDDVRPLSSTERDNVYSFVSRAESAIEESLINPRRNCPCEACKHLRREGSSIREAVVHEYSYSPGTWTPRSVARDPYNWFMGVELETDRRPNGLNNAMAAGMRLPARFWVTKRDGSVSGPEFASYPATLTFWREHYSEFAEMFRMLIHAGFRSHDGGNAGMHVNISKSAFGDAGHFARFMRLVHYSVNWSLIMSQRTNGQTDRWCSLREYTGDSDILARADAVMNTGRYYANKYTAVNTPNGQSRVEFRLPRGTLRIDRFFKNLEWSAAMVDFTRDISTMSESNPSSFMGWVGEASDKWPNLYTFMNEKAEGLVIAARDKSLAR